MRAHQSILLGSVVGAFLVYLTHSIAPITIFLSATAEAGNPTSIIIVYLTIPIVIGAITGYVERESASLNGLTSGLLSGIINLSISLGEVEQYKYSLGYPSSLQNQFNQLDLLALMLTLLWGILAAFSAKFTAWSPG